MGERSEHDDDEDGAWTFCLPLRLPGAMLPHHNDSASEPVYRVPAMACPLLWYIVLDGRTSASWYWKHASRILQATLTEVPSHVHVGILLLAGDSDGDAQVGVFQTDSPVPHLRRYPVGADIATVLAETALPVQDYRENFLAIARSCPQIPVSHQSSTTTNSSGDAWATLVSQLADGLVQVGQPAGQRKEGSDRSLLPYAGAFCTCLRPSPAPAVAQRSSPDTARLCAQAVLTVQTVFCIDPTAQDWQDVAYEQPPVISSIEAPSLAWYAYDDNDNGSLAESQAWATWAATWPWRRAVVYGANLRLRTSPGVSVSTDDDDDEEETADIGMPFSKEGGLTGPAVEDSPSLWTLPSADPYTTLTIDLQMTDLSMPSDRPHPAIGLAQVCLAYTALEADEDGQVWTVRRMRVASRALPIAETKEGLYRRVDPEALAVVLLHMLVRCPDEERQILGEEWLQALLVAIYESAVEENARLEELRERGVDNDKGYFSAAARLLGKPGGDFSATDVLLAQGHGRMQPISLLLFLLLQQCQQSSRSSTTCWDSNALSMSDLVRMSPDSLTRCLAPRLQLWSCDEVLVDLMDLRQESVLDTIHEEMALLKNPKDSLLLVLDAPDQIVVANARAYLPGGSPETAGHLPQLGRTLQLTLKDMAASYPTPPPILYGGSDGWLDDVCREDRPVGNRNFAEWRAAMAKTVYQELLRRKLIDTTEAVVDV
jgi:hypothetical protein